MNKFSKFKIQLAQKPYLHHNDASKIRKKILDQERHYLFTKRHPLKTIIGLSLAPFFIIIVNAIYQLSDTIITAALTDETIMINGQANNVATISINAFFNNYGAINGDYFRHSSGRTILIF